MNKSFRDNLKRHMNMVPRLTKAIQNIFFAVLVFLFSLQSIQAEENRTIDSIPLNEQFLHYIRHRFDDYRQNDVMPKSLAEWKTARKKIYDKLAENIGLIQEKQCDLNPMKIGEIKQDGYRIEKLVLQTFPEIHATAFAYVPEGEGPFPAVLCVHGHWKKAKQEPTVQSRCIGLAKLGFFVLAVDAFGAGERGIGKELGEYHGAAVGATLFPSGLLLPGLQIYENSRFVDYLQSRHDVIPDKIGVTGASGGGNQTMYAGAMEERFKAVVPVCSVGTYRSYLGAACCYCELLPGTMNFTEEWALLSMTAPRALMVVNATKDVIQFSPGEAEKSIKNSLPVFQFYGKEKNIKHSVFVSGHDYNKEMREVMYGWMTLHLKGKGTGEPIPEPEHKTIEPEKLRCFPGDSRPNEFTNLVQFAESRSRNLVNERNSKINSSNWEVRKKELKESLEIKLNSRYSKKHQTTFKNDVNSKDEKKFKVYPEAGIVIGMEYQKGQNNKLAILIDLNDETAKELLKVSDSLMKKGWNVMIPELRNTGSRKVTRDRIGNATDHNSTEWSLWNGIPQLGQWVTDVRSLINVAESMKKGTFEEVVLIGIDSGGTIAVTSGIMDERINKVISLDMLSSFIPNAPFEHDRLGVLVPGILKEVGDVSHLCSLFAPRNLIIAGGHLADGKPLDTSSLQQEFSFAKNVEQWSAKNNQLQVQAEWNHEDVVSWVTE